MLRAFVDNPTCKHIIFGGCHDAGYLVSLDQYKHDPEKVARITLLKSTSSHPGFNDLPFQPICFDDVFRNKPLPEGPNVAHSRQPGQLAPTAASVTPPAS